MDQDIKIVAEPGTTPNSCKFVVDREVLADEGAYFPASREAEGSPLAEQLFAVDGISTVLLAGNTVALTKNTAEDWPVVAKQIGSAIREHIGSGKPAVSEAFFANRPDEDAIRSGAQRVLDNEINPMVAGHGGNISLIDVKGSTVFIKMGGGCQGCGQADVTLKTGVEQALRAAVPGIGEILDSTDHAAGRNPYYAPSGSK